MKFISFFFLFLQLIFFSLLQILVSFLCSFIFSHVFSIILCKIYTLNYSYIYIHSWHRQINFVILHNGERKGMWIFCFVNVFSLVYYLAYKCLQYSNRSYSCLNFFSIHQVEVSYENWTWNNILKKNKNVMFSQIKW